MCDVYETRLMDLLGLSALDAKAQSLNGVPRC
jgi:hypothetical protein